MDSVNLSNLSPGVFANTIKSPHSVSSGREGSPVVSKGVVTLPGNSRGTFDSLPPPEDPIPGPISREDLGRQIDLLA